MKATGIVRRLDDLGRLVIPKEIRLGSEIIFSVDFSNRVDGIKMFERFTTLSKDIKIKYQNNKIKVSLPKRQDSLPLAIEVLSLAKECTR